MSTAAKKAKDRATRLVGFLVFAREASDSEWSFDWDELINDREEAEQSAKRCVESWTEAGLQGCEAFVATVIREGVPVGD